MKNIIAYKLGTQIIIVYIMGIRLRVNRIEENNDFQNDLVRWELC